MIFFSWMRTISHRDIFSSCSKIKSVLFNSNVPINVMPAGGRQGMGWGFDCLCWPWSRAFEWSCSPRGGDIWIFLRPTWRYLTADSDEKDWERTYVSHFHASRMRRTVWKDLEIMEANENKRKLSGFHCFVFKSTFASTIDQCMAQSL